MVGKIGPNENEDTVDAVVIRSSVGADTNNYTNSPLRAFRDVATVVSSNPERDFFRHGGVCSGICHQVRRPHLDRSL